MIPYLDWLEPRERVCKALTDPICGSGTDGEIAELCDVSPKYVRRVRREVTQGKAVREVLETARAQKHAEGLGHLSTLHYLKILLRDRERNEAANPNRGRAPRRRSQTTSGHRPDRKVAGQSSPAVRTQEERTVGDGDGDMPAESPGAPREERDPARGGAAPPYVAAT